MALIVCGLQSKQGRNLFWIIVYAFVGLVLSSAVIFFFFSCLDQPWLEEQDQSLT